MHSPSGLEVNHQSQHSELELNRQAAVYPDQGPEFHDPKASNDVHHNHVPRVCGLMSRRMFWISVAAVVIIITTAAAALVLSIICKLSTDNHNKSTTVSPQMTGASSTGYIEHGSIEYG